MTDSSSSEPMVVAVDAKSTPTEEKPVSLEVADIIKTILYISRGVELQQPRLIHRAIRQNVTIRRTVTGEQLAQVVKKVIPSDWASFAVISEAVGKIPLTPVVAPEATEDSAMDVDTPAPVDISNIPPTTVLPEVEVYVFTLVVTTLLRVQLNTDAAYYATLLIERIRTFNRRSLDVVSSKAFFYFALSYDRIDRSNHIVSTLLALYRTACVRHDEMSQAVLLNLLLRNYLQHNLIEQAHTLSLRTTFPESASNNQFCRFLYYMGRIQAIQLEYSAAYQRLMMAVRKAPQGAANEFTSMAYKLAVIVQLLMGDIPERSLFNQPELRKPLYPYLILTQAVRNGDSLQFQDAVTKFDKIFKADKNDTLIQRLGHNVLKTGLRKISTSYSRISLADIAEKLHLSSATAAEYICAKAIRDGVIEAKIDHEQGYLTSHELVDIYSTEEPQNAFHKRIAFCLDIHNEAVKSMRYPPESHTKKGDKDAKSGENKQDELTIDEIIKEIQDDMDKEE